MSSTATAYMLAKMSNQVYKDVPQVPDGWRVLQSNIDSESGFAAVAFKSDTDGKIVIAYRGTDGWNDAVGADTAIAGIKNWDPQFTQGIEFAKTIIDQNPGVDISVTGHSLGGATAQVVGQMFGFDGAAFEPGGAANLISTSESKGPGSN